MKIAVYSICKNEEKHIERFLASAYDADYIIVADTGSTDASWPMLCKASAASERPAIHVGQVSVLPFRFDDARNAALAAVSSDVDMCIAMDMDEVLMPGWREHVEHAFAGGATNIACTFEFTSMPSFIQNNRIHSRQGWRWKYPAHEALVPNMQSAPVRMVEPLIVMRHLPDDSKPRCYLKQLAWGEFENPRDARMKFYYGRELMFFKYYKEAIERFGDCLQLGAFESGEAGRYLDFCTKQLASGDQMKSQSCSPETQGA